MLERLSREDLRNLLPLGLDEESVHRVKNFDALGYFAFQELWNCPGREIP